MAVNKDEKYGGIFELGEIKEYRLITVTWSNLVTRGIEDRMKEGHKWSCLEIQIIIVQL